MFFEWDSKTNSKRFDEPLFKRSWLFYFLDWPWLATVVKIQNSSIESRLGIAAVAKVLNSGLRDGICSFVKVRIRKDLFLPVSIHRIPLFYFC